LVVQALQHPHAQPVAPEARPRQLLRKHRRQRLLHAAVITWLAGAAAAAFKVPPLPYNMSALAPAIPEDTLKLHYGVHTQVTRKKRGAVSGRRVFWGWV